MQCVHSVPDHVGNEVVQERLMELMNNTSILDDDVHDGSGAEVGEGSDGEHHGEEEIEDKVCLWFDSHSSVQELGHRSCPTSL